MNTKFLKITGITIGSVAVAAYAIFLLAPFVVSPIVNSYAPQINEEVKKATGLSAELEGFRLVTTPKLTVGAKVGRFTLLTPDKKEIMRADDFQVKMSLLPLLVKRIEVDLVKLKNLDVNLGINKDGSFEIEKYFPVQEEAQSAKTEEVDVAPFELPFGLKLSNHLPDIKVGGYNLSFKDISTGKTYDIKGNKTEITDFVINKGIKIAADGSVILAGREQFKYNAKVYNKIMPDIDLNDLIFTSQEAEQPVQQKEDFKINVLDIFKGLYDNKITANLDTDVVITKDGNSGFLNIDNMSVAPSGLVLPPSDLGIKLKGNKVDINANLYTAQNEATKVTGLIKTGKTPNVDISVKSGVELANIIKIVNAVAMTFNIKDLQTLSANGKLDADFNIKSDMKKLASNGYLKIPSAVIKYGLYNITIDKINADVALENNNINIKNIGFSIYDQPLRLYGTINEAADADLHLTATDLSLKGLVVACGQAALLKENPITSGTVSLNADIVGRLDSIKPTAKVALNNIDLTNTPSNTRVKLPKTIVDIISDGKTFNGMAVSDNIKAINPAATVSVPKVNVTIKEDVIEVAQTPVQVEKINFNVSGKIKNYMSEKIVLDFVTTGDIKSTLTGDMNAVKQTLNLNFAAPQNSTIIIPMFDKSKLTFNGNIGISGSMMNPVLSGTINVPTISIPEVIVNMENLVAKLHGPILTGAASVEKFVSGGIVATAITSDFSMKGNDFYLNNLKGSAFDGKFNGDIVYNMANAKTKVDFAGKDMNAEKAIRGAAGIKNALSGTLEFDTKLNLTVYPDYNDMMRSMTGNMTFKIANGAFGAIGRIEHLLGAPNILNSVILKNTVSTLSNLAGIKNSAEFAFLSGDMSFSNGWVNIEHIKSAGASISYFITGKYNLINGTANVVILGRMNNKVVKLLGPLGDLSAEKILSHIPKLGDLTASLSKAVTTDPATEKVSAIPVLTDTESGHKDFKVEYNGGLESQSSVKSFKWLTKSDTSNLEQKTITDTIKSIKPSVNTDVKETVDSVKNIIDNVKTQKEDLKNLFKF